MQILNESTKIHDEDQSKHYYICIYDNYQFNMRDNKILYNVLNELNVNNPIYHQHILSFSLSIR